MYLFQIYRRFKFLLFFLKGKQDTKHTSVMAQVLNEDFPVLVGSRAIKHWDRRFYRVPRDVDIYLTMEHEQTDGVLLDQIGPCEKTIIPSAFKAKNQLFAEGQKALKPILFSLVPLKVLSFQMICAIKVQQLSFDLHWMKTIEDVLYLEKFHGLSRKAMRAYTRIEFFTPYLKKSKCQDATCQFAHWRTFFPQSMESIFENLKRESQDQTGYFSLLKHLYHHHVSRRKQIWIEQHYYQLKWAHWPSDATQNHRDSNQWNDAAWIDTCLFAREIWDAFLPYPLQDTINDFLKPESLLEEEDQSSSSSSSSDRGRSSSSSSSRSGGCCCCR